MGKRKKIKNLTVYGVVEDQIEFIEYLKEIYQPSLNNISFKIKNSNGGNPDSIMKSVFDENYKRDMVFAWFDEDFYPENDLGKKERNNLAILWKINQNDLSTFLNCPLPDLQEAYNSSNKKPILIVSKPVCSESIIIKVLGHEIPESVSAYNSSKRDQQIKSLKHKLKTIIGENEKIDFYRKNINKEILEEKRNSIPELNLLISMITN